jgi:hypothetical protein
MVAVLCGLISTVTTFALTQPGGHQESTPPDLLGTIILVGIVVAILIAVAIVVTISLLRRTDPRSSQ